MIKLLFLLLATINVHAEQTNYLYNIHYLFPDKITDKAWDIYSQGEKNQLDFIFEKHTDKELNIYAHNVERYYEKYELNLEVMAIQEYLDRPRANLMVDF